LEPINAKAADKEIAVFIDASASRSANADDVGRFLVKQTIN